MSRILGNRWNTGSDPLHVFYRGSVIKWKPDPCYQCTGLLSWRVGHLRMQHLQVSVQEEKTASWPCHRSQLFMVLLAFVHSMNCTQKDATSHRLLLLAPHVLGTHTVVSPSISTAHFQGCQEKVRVCWGRARSINSSPALAEEACSPAQQLCSGSQRRPGGSGTRSGSSTLPAAKAAECLINPLRSGCDG